MASDIRSLLPVNLNQVGYRNVLRAFFYLKVSSSKNLAEILTKSWDKTNWRVFSILKRITNDIVLKNIDNF